MFKIPRKFGLAIGILAVAEFTVLYLVAMSLDPNYTFGENYLSDLGVGPGAWAFNSALIITGILLSCFALFGLAGLLAVDSSGRVAVALLAIDGIILVGVGVFPEDVKPYHYIFSVAFFLTFLLVAIAMTIAFYRTHVLGNLGTIVSGIATVFGMLLLPMGGNPLSETMAVMAIIGWGVVIASAFLAKEYGKAIP